MKIGDLIKRIPRSRLGLTRIGIVTRKMAYDRYEVIFFDDNCHYNMDKRLLVVISESR